MPKATSLTYSTKHYRAIITIIVSMLLSNPALGEEKRELLNQYWFDENELNALANTYPEMNIPAITPQCKGSFFQSRQQLSNQQQSDTASQNDNETQEQQTISADKVIYQADGTATFTGNVILNQGDQSISGDKVRYHKAQNRIDISGNVTMEQEGMLVSSSQANYDSAKKQSHLENAAFLIFDNGLNGYAKQMKLAKVETDIYDSRITSCPPGKENWLLQSKELHLDQEKGWGHAKHASLKLGKVPVLYAPYFTFPLDDRRKTGFLYPGIGSDSLNGVDISTPYYINIAPNYDATLTPRILSKRGQQIGAEFRYLNVTGEGEISGDYLGNDKINNLYSERKQAQWHHQLSFSESWDASADYFYVSDSDYFDDLDSLSGNTALGYLERNASVSYIERDAYFGVLVQDFQVLDTIAEINKPYRLAPQINAGSSSAVSNTPISLNIDGQLSQFERDLDPLVIGNAAILSGELSTGSRLVLQPGIEAEFSAPAYFIRPAARLHHRQYQLEDYQAIGQSAELDADIPIYSLDSGLIFERNLIINGQNYQQTLEPRIKWLGIPYENQTGIPDFDTGLLTFNKDQLFRDRRYSGHDLVGDTEQASLGLSSRFYNEDGYEDLSLHLGQIVYFDDRQIQFDASEDRFADVSPLVAEADYRMIPNWTLTQQLLWDSEDNQLEQVASGIHYKNGNGSNIANLEFRYRPNSLIGAQKETRASVVWPISNRWKAMSFWNFDLNQHSTIELASGLEYENCCVIVRALNQKWLRKITSTNTYESTNKQSLELQLKGLGMLNNQISDYLKNKITGFE